MCSSAYTTINIYMYYKSYHNTAHITVLYTLYSNNPNNLTILIFNIVFDYIYQKQSKEIVTFFVCLLVFYILGRQGKQ